MNGVGKRKFVFTQKILNGLNQKFMHLNSELLFSKYAKPFFKDKMRILEIGPAGYPSAYENLVNKKSIEWHTMDFGDSSFIDNAADNLTYKLIFPTVFPIQSDQYDIVLSGQVIEHVDVIWKWIEESKRILRPGGILIIINPVSWPYHEAPIDCWRIYPDGIKALAKFYNLSIEISKFESLEKEFLLKYDKSLTFIGGKSFNYPPDKAKITIKKIKINRILRFLRILNKQTQFPVEVAFDTISILRKSYDKSD